MMVMMVAIVTVTIVTVTVKLMMVVIVIVMLISGDAFESHMMMVSLLAATMGMVVALVLAMASSVVL